MALLLDGASPHLQASGITSLAFCFRRHSARGHASVRRLSLTIKWPDFLARSYYVEMGGCAVSTG